MCETSTVVRGRYHHVLPDGRLECDLCPRRCRLKDGQRGFCFVREAQGDAICLTSYGRASGFCIDPIEKKPLNHFYPGSSVLSFGTAGCNLGCRFCQNWDISKARAHDRLMDTAMPTDIVAAARDAGCKSIAFTYNDPVIFAEYAIDTAKEARLHGIESVAVTAGYITEAAREDFFKPLSAANIDLKAFTETFYDKLCFAHLGPVLETLKFVHEQTNVWLEITTLLIPGQNDSSEELTQLCEWIGTHLGPDVPLHFSAYHPDYKLTAPATPGITLTRARDLARAIGLHHVYTGNVHDVASQSTYCSTCQQRLIERDGYDIGQFRITATGRCPGCDTPLPGRFDARPGTWGTRRQPIAIRRRLPLLAERQQR